VFISFSPSTRALQPFKDYGFTQHSKQLETVEASKRSAAPVIDGKNMELLFLIDDKPGGLTEVLQLFSKHGVNLSRIESRPSKTK
jgi:prephenate dehydratase